MSRIVEIANTRILYGVSRIHVLLRRKVGNTIKSMYTLSTKSKALTCAVKDLVEARWQPTGWSVPNRLTYTSVGQWILCLNSCSMPGNLGS